MRVSCDSFVALGGATADGATLFAKNSDRPAGECQPLVQFARARHPEGARLRCQYIEIPQVAETARVIGSRPFWLWGFEHGLNEHSVAIGNHTVFTRDSLGAPGLIGMDLVRLGLERSHNAREALETIAALAERYGQGGSGYFDKDWPYHSSFLVADAEEAYLLETSDRRWAARRIRDVGSASNHVSIGTDWDMLSDDAISHAVSSGWWPVAGTHRFDFAAAYRDTSFAPEVISSGRHRRGCEMLAERCGRHTVESLQRILRDHYGSLPGSGHYTPADERYFAICMHAEPVGTTTASMVARLPHERSAPACMWASLGSPCVGVFLPLYAEGELPPALSRGGEHSTSDSPWWRFQTLWHLVARDLARRLPPVRARWDELERKLAAESAAVEARAAALRREGLAAQASTQLTHFMNESVRAMHEQLEGLIDELERS